MNEEFELPQDLPYDEEPILDKSTQNQKTIQFLIEKYGPNITLQEAFERYEKEKGENLDKTFYDGDGDYDYENRPVKITDIKYELSATKEETERMIEELQKKQESILLFVPFYNRSDEADSFYYEGIVDTRFLTRHILDSDYQYNSIKWRYEEGLFRFAIWKDDLKKFTGYLHYKLNKAK